ncbi:MAG: TrmH family RNA methyltransferase, partial [Muribaculaceae bacterium]|nr:TrmH family RNA methyltransferase [Muribaculaceae bacterium]
MKKKNIAELTNCSVEEYREVRKLPFAVLLDNVRSMQNVGSILRTSDAFLVKEVVMAGITGVPPHKEISK